MVKSLRCFDCGGVMTNNLFPDEYYDSTFEIDYKSYYDKGFCAIVFDIDNTLAEHDAPIESNVRAIDLVARLKQIGFKVMLLSNNDAARVTPFARALDVPFVAKGGKPLARGYLEAGRLMEVSPEKTLAIGDQIFTDVWGGNRAGMHTIMVGRIASHEEIQIHIKRVLEKPILCIWRRRQHS